VRCYYFPPSPLRLIPNRICRQTRASDTYDFDQPSFKFNNSLVEGIKHLQQRLQLPISGKIDVKTLAALNIPPYHMAQKIALNIKRWRHLPPTLGHGHIMVNMADFRLQYKEGDKTSLDMKVIMGRPHVARLF
jgi:murein L,D-transpeptidase YcbB/YkuD